MLRRFNSLIKGPKLGGQISDDELSELHVSLRPALSVDSSLFTSSQHHHVNPLQQQLARQREESLTRARSARGQTSLNAGLLELEERQPGHGFVMGRVPEEDRSWKEGYEQQGTHNFHSSLDSPSKPSPGQSNTDGETGDAPRAPLRTSSNAIVPASRTTSRDLHTIVDIPDAQPGSGVDLECVRKSILTTGPGRTISSWSTDSAAEHCRICQQRTEEPLIELGCLCRGEMSKSHKSCIEMWFKNKGTNKCEVCQHVASNVAAPEASLAGRFHALWAALGILVGGLLFDVLISIFLGASALPVNIIIGVLVVLGLGTAVRLVLEYMQERNVQRNIRLMEMQENPANEDSAEGGADRATAQNGASSAV